jgi:hypothetical protein
MLWVSLIVLNSLFIDRMSYEPDRIRAFQQSGYATMGEYWKHQHSLGPFPLLMSVAAVIGTVGGGIRRATHRSSA